MSGEEMGVEEARITDKDRLSGNMLSVSHDEAEVLIAGGASIVPTLAVMAGFTRIIRLGDTWYAEREP